MLLFDKNTISFRDVLEKCCEIANTISQYDFIVNSSHESITSFGIFFMKKQYETPEKSDRNIVQNISQKHIIILWVKSLVIILLGNISERRIDEKYRKLDKIVLNDC